MKSDDETPWWCQLLWPWFGRPWYAEIEDPDAFWAAIGRQTGELAGDDRTCEGYLTKGGTADRRPLPGRRDHQARVRPADIRRGGRRRPGRRAGLGWGTAGGDRAAIRRGQR
jgi:hypothetical protein